MFQNALVIVIVCLIVVLILRYVFTAKRLANENGHEPFSAVSIHNYAEGCPSFAATRGRNFLVADAPLLPLEGCTAASCQCTYKHHVDRRSGTRDRRSAWENDDSEQFEASHKKRLGRGNRSSDFVAA
jgi:hypothetical protein